MRHDANEIIEEDKKEYINELTYKIVLLTNYLPILINYGNLCMSVDKYKLIERYFTEEAKISGYKGEPANYMKDFIESIIGCKYSYKSLSSNGEVTSAGSQDCYIITTEKTPRKDILLRKNFFLINVRTMNGKGKIRDRVKIDKAWNELVTMVKSAVHSNDINVVVPSERYKELPGNKNVKAVEFDISATYLYYCSKLYKQFGDDINIICINEDGLASKYPKSIDVHNTVRSLQKMGMFW